MTGDVLPAVVAAGRGPGKRIDVGRSASDRGVTISRRSGRDGAKESKLARGWTTVDLDPRCERILRRIPGEKNADRICLELGRTGGGCGSIARRQGHGGDVRVRRPVLRIVDGADDEVVRRAVREIVHPNGAATPAWDCSGIPGTVVDRADHQFWSVVESARSLMAVAE